MKFRSRSLLAVFAFFLVIVAVALVVRHRQTGDAVRIGGVFSLTGKTASFGQWVQKGAILAVEEVNATGGIGGKDLRLVSEDTQSEPTLAVSSLERILAVDKPVAVVGFITSSEALACAPIAERNRVVMITPIAATPKLQDAGDYIFRTRENAGADGRIIAEYLVDKRQIETAAIIYENADNAIGYRDAFVGRYQELGGSIAKEYAYNSDEKDFRTVLTQLKASRVPAVYAPGVGKNIGRILSQAAELDWHPLFLSSAGIEDPELFTVAGDAANGVIYAAPAFSLTSDDSTTHRFVVDYRARWQDDPSPYSANSFDAVMLIAAALRSGATTSDQIKDYLYRIEGYPGASGTLGFDEFGEVRKPVVLKIIDNRCFNYLP